MPRSPSRLAVVFALLALLLAACSESPRQAELRALRIDVADRPEAFQAAYRERRAAAEAAPEECSPSGALAQFYHANGFLDEAAVLYRKLAACEPAAARWSYLLSLIYQDRGSAVEALDLLDTVVRLDPSYRLAALRQGDLLRKSGDEPAARAKYQSCIDRNLFLAHARLGLGMIASRSEAWAEAVEHLEASIKADSGMATAYKLLASAYSKLGYAEKAKQAAAWASHYGRQSDAADPWLDAVNDHCFDSYRLTVIADRLIAANQRERAKSILYRACKANPQDARARYDLAKALGKEPAVQAERRLLLEQAIELDPLFNDAYMELAVAKAEADDNAGAMVLVERGLARDPESPGLHRMQGRIHERLKAFDKGKASFEKAIALNPKDAESFITFGNFLWARGEKAAAITQYERAVELSMIAVEPRAMLAARHVENGEFDKAISLIEDARFLDTDVEGLDELLSLAHLRRGNAAIRRKELDTGESDLKRALAVKKDSIEALNNLCSLYFSTERANEALTVAGAFVERNPKIAFGYQLLAGSKMMLGQKAESLATLRQGLEVARSTGQSEQARELETLIRKLTGSR